MAFFEDYDKQPPTVGERFYNWLVGATTADQPAAATDRAASAAFAGAVVGGAVAGNAGDADAEELARAVRQRLRGEDQAPIRGLVGGRISQDNPDQYGGGLQAFAIFSPRNSWRKFLANDNIKLSDFANVRIDDLAELLADLSPEVSDALWKYLLMCNAGYEIVAHKFGTDTPDKKAQALLDAMLKKLASYHGSLDVFFNRIFMTIALRGSTLAELVMDETGADFVDIATPDTRTLRYKKREDPLRGIVWTFGQLQNAVFVSLETEKIRYAPLHPLPNSIEGRPLLSASFFLSIFLMAILRDFKRVIQQQGYPRLDVEIDFDKIRDAMPADAQNNPEKFEQWVNGIVAQVVAVYKKLQPDDTYVHTNVTKVNAPVGAINTNSLTAMDGLFKALERMTARALHTMPLLLGITDGVSEANANRQWEIYAKGIESVQHLVENTLAPLFELALQGAGILATVQIRFAQMRAAEKLRDAQVEFLEAQTAAYQRDQGWIDQDAAAVKGAGVKKAVAPAPAPVAVQPAGNGIAALGTGDKTNAALAVAQLLAVPESDRTRLLATLVELDRAPTAAQLENASKLWKDNAAAEAAALLEAQPASEAEN